MVWPSERAAVVFLLAATVWAGRPWAWSPDQAFILRDTGFNQVGIAHLENVLLHGAGWREVPLAWPLKDATSQVDWMLGEAALALPLRALDPAHIHSALVFLGLFLTAWAGHRVAVALFGRGPHTWIAGLAAGLNPVQLAHAQHVNLLHHEWALLGPLLLGAGLAGRRAALAGLGGAVTLLGFHFGVYVGLHALFVGAIVGVCAAVARVGDRRSWAVALLGAALVGATVAPVLALYRDAAASQHMGIQGSEITAGSWDLRRTLAPIPGAPLHALLPSWFSPSPPAGHAPEPLLEPPSPGYVVAGLALFGWVAGRRKGSDRQPRAPRWTWIAVTAVILLTALAATGPDLVWAGRPSGLPGAGRLLAGLPGYSALRAPARWLAITFAGTGLLAACGLATLIRTASPSWRRALIPPLLLGAALLEMPRTTSGPLAHILPEPAYALLDEVTEEGGLYDKVSTRGCPNSPEQRLRAALFHGRPLVGGEYARAFQSIQQLNGLAASWPSPESEALFRAVGVPLVFEHPPLPPLAEGGGPKHCRVQDGHRLCVLDGPHPAPRPAAVTTTGSGPVVGLRWPQGLDQPWVTLTCDGVATLIPPRMWGLVGRLTYGADLRATDVYLDHPCPSVPTADAPGAVPLYAAGPPAPFAWPPRPFRMGDGPFSIGTPLHH